MTFEPKQTAKANFLENDDYRECGMLMLQLLGVTPPGGNKWYKPTASSNARWMVAVLFGSKIVAFSDQLQFEDGELEKFERFVTFCSPLADNTARS